MDEQEIVKRMTGDLLAGKWNTPETPADFLAFSGKVPEDVIQLDTFIRQHLFQLEGIDLPRSLWKVQLEFKLKLILFSRPMKNCQKKFSTPEIFFNLNIEINLNLSCSKTSKLINLSL